MLFQNPRHPKGQTQDSTRHYSLIIFVISFGFIKTDRLSAFMKYFLKAHIPLTWCLLFRFGLVHMHQSQGGHFHIKRRRGPDKNFRGEFWGQVPSISHYRSTPEGVSQAQLVLCHYNVIELQWRKGGHHGIVL